VISDSEVFSALMAEVLHDGREFGHREHVEVTWRAVRSRGTQRTVELVSAGLRQTARYAGVPQKYNATVSRAWVELVAHHVAEAPQVDEFAEFAARNPDLLDKRLLARFYRPATLASPQARTGWVEPDRSPFPWQLPGSST
jgi:hypothetical protein